VKTNHLVDPVGELESAVLDAKARLGQGGDVAVKPDEVGHCRNPSGADDRQSDSTRYGSKNRHLAGVPYNRRQRWPNRPPTPRRPPGTSNCCKTRTPLQISAAGCSRCSPPSRRNTT